MDADFTAVAALVLAGGSGERFWPLSRPHRPKQLLDLDGSGKCMLRQAVDHLNPLIPPNQLYISTNRLLAPTVRKLLKDIPASHIYAEPCTKNTGGALIYTLARMLAAKGEEKLSAMTLALVTADQKIERRFCFHRMLREAVATAQAEDALVLCGIMPSRPEKGFGYIETTVSTPFCARGKKMVAWPVKAFHEKPDAARARRFISTGRHFWNSGMLFCRFSVLMNQLQKARPDMAALVYQLATLIREKRLEEVDALFATLEAISIDHALLEHAGRILMVRGDFSWRDMGTWQSVAEERTPDDMGNVTAGNAAIMDCRDSIIWNAATDKGISVAALGLSDIVLVVTEDAVLVMHKEHAHDLKKLLAEMASKKKNVRQPKQKKDGDAH
ncbi:MAG TPA: sugar phosphate nucleotidyltransferase [Candidatus Hydrogenedentes bacterium]|nr:sugar phosphate nucleotidyltransferase [Candidatus Hydrogenedentota bacterium]